MSSNPRVPFELSTERAPLPAPDGKPLIIQLVVNLENWRFDEAMPRRLLPAASISLALTVSFPSEDARADE